MPGVDRPPTPRAAAYTHERHGVSRPDPYAWMRERESPELLEHLTREREWYGSATSHLGPQVDELRAEMRRRLPTTDRSVSWRHQGCYYYSEVPPGRDYPRLLRVRRTDVTPERAGDDAAAELLLDANALVSPGEHLDLGLLEVSPDGRLLAYSVDQTGEEVYELRWRDLETSDDLADVVTRSYYGGAWTPDSAAFLYTVHDAAYRPHQVWRHALGTPVADDTLVLEEPDERFELDVRATRSGLVVLTAQSRTTSEVWTLDASETGALPWSVGGRRDGVEYAVDHAPALDALLVVTDAEATESRLARCPVPHDAHQDHTKWEPVRPEVETERLLEVDAFARHAVLTYRSGFQRRLRVLTYDDLAGPGLVIDPVEPAATVSLAANHELDVDTVTVEDATWLAPPVWSDLDLATGARTERHRGEAPGHDPAAYVAEVRLVESADGTEVPATLMRHRDTPLDGSAPALVYGYGAYEAVFEPEWDPALPSLLDRGVAYVFAHVRGGGEGGRRWWLDGRMEHKQHTFDDHLAVADGLAALGLVDGDRLASRGLSAGGLLQGAVFSQRPERWRAVVAEVPFVDVVTTMLDASIPLTVGEWEEWGDPRREADFAWMLAYSPYDNPPAAGARPDLLVTGALHDPRVMVSEPAKWVARLRETDPEWGPRCLFRVETGAGAHAGPSGRFAHLDYEAEVAAWVLSLLTDKSVGGSVAP